MGPDASADSSSSPVCSLPGDGWSVAEGTTEVAEHGLSSQWVTPGTQRSVASSQMHRAPRDLPLDCQCRKHSASKIHASQQGHVRGKDDHLLGGVEGCSSKEGGR